jgi:hypothetical protein
MGLLNGKPSEKLPLIQSSINLFISSSLPKRKGQRLLKTKKKQLKSPQEGLFLLSPNYI